MIPMTNHREGIVLKVFQYVANIGCEDLNEAQSHRLTLDGDFWEQFNDKLHGGL